VPPSQLHATRLFVAPTPLRIALALADRPGLCLLWASSPLRHRFGRYSFVAADPDRVVHALDPVAEDDLERAPARGSTLASAPRWIGVIPYEARRELERRGWTRDPDERPAALVTRASWARYPAVVRIDHLGGEVLVIGTSRGAIADVCAAVRRGPRAELAAIDVGVTDPEAPERHVARVKRAVELIEAGALDQVNLSRRLALQVECDREPAHAALALYARLTRTAPSPFGACLSLGDERFLLSTTPELLLDAAVTRAGGFGRMWTAPIKGTRPRGASADEDRAQRVELEGDPKERAELTMIIDVERNDLGRVAVPGSVRVARGPEITTHRTLHHREAWLSARARPEASRAEVLSSMVPSGSVTGAPKVRAMEVIAELEPHRRGVYTGGFGFVAHDGSTRLAMAIRTAVLAGRAGEYLTGGGIVADSLPERELLETTWKSAQVRRAAGAPAPDDPAYM
jgi:anthranilate/para-aminobenzoate synthase component I